MNDQEILAQFNGLNPMEYINADTENYCSECFIRIPKGEKTCSVKCWNDKYDRLESNAIDDMLEDECRKANPLHWEVDSDD
jgi:hypothetical protein